MLYGIFHLSKTESLVAYVTNQWWPQRMTVAVYFTLYSMPKGSITWATSTQNCKIMFAKTDCDGIRYSLTIISPLVSLHLSKWAIELIRWSVYDKNRFTDLIPESCHFDLHSSAEKNVIVITSPLKTCSSQPCSSQNSYFFKNGPSPASYSFIFVFSNKYYNFYNK